MDRVKAKQKIWFVSPNLNGPTGGINAFYRLCDIAKEIGIEAHVISDEPYTFVDPSDFIKYWKKGPNIGYRPDMFDIPDIQEGDIIVQPEIYNWKPWFKVPVRRVTYLQNWAISSENTWENHYWVYNNMTFTTYCFEQVYPSKRTSDMRIPPSGMEISTTFDFINTKKVKWSSVTPYFDKNEFKNYEKKDIDIIMFPRKSPEVVEEFKNHFGNRVLSVNGVSPLEVKELLGRSKIIVLSSAAEGICFPSIEAMLSGAVVVTWNCGGPEDFLIDGYSAMMAKYGNVNELISKTEYLLKNENERIEISKSAFNLMSNLYNRENSKKDLLLAYYSCLSIYPEGY